MKVKRKDKSLVRRFFVLTLTFLLVLIQIPPTKTFADTQEVVDTKEQKDISLYVGDLVGLKVYSLTRIAISKNGIVDIVNADVDEILIVGKSVGDTQIFIWDEFGKRTLVARVFEEDLNLLQERIEKLLAEAKIAGVTLRKNNLERKIVATGMLLKDDLEEFNTIVKTTSNSIINLVKERPDLVQIDVQITELNTTLEKALGVDWIGETEDSFRLAYQETLPQTDGSVADFFKIGDFNRVDAIQATVNALIKEGKARVLSKPSIVVSNGEEARFLVGGEIPIRTTTSNNLTGGTQENITFKEYGVDLTVTPEIISGKVDMTVEVDVRDIDAANAVGNDVAFTTRTASTKLFLESGQTIVLAGLIKHVENEQIKRLPFLSSIPVVGMLFRVKTTPTAQQEQELVITITPRFIYQEPMEDEGEGRGPQSSSEMKKGDEKETFEPEEKSEEESFSKEDMGNENVTDETSWEAGMANEETLDEDVAAEPLMEDQMVDENMAETEKGADEDISSEASNSSWTMETEEPAGTMMPSEEEAETDEMMKPGTESAASGVSQVITKYVQSIQKQISQAISFPYEAREKQWEGTVTLVLKVLSDGTLASVEVKNSSGYKIFDQDALNTAQILAPYEPFPAEIDLDELIITVPIIYSQKALLDEDIGS